MQLNRKILNLRLDRKLTSSALAHACKVSNGTISKVETGRSLPDSKTLFLIARFLGVTVEYLLDENQPYPYRPLRYRGDFLKNGDPSAVVHMLVTREEKALLQALRRAKKLARDLAYAIPETDLETLAKVHCLILRKKLEPHILPRVRRR